MSGKYRLAYFDVRALGEPIRWLFAYTKTPFEDERIPWDYPKWFSEIKQKYYSTVGQVPVLYEEGKPELSQSTVISRYLAQKHGLTAGNPWDDARLEEVVNLVFDLFHFWRTYIMFAMDPERKKTVAKPMCDGKFKLHYAKWNQILEASGGPYIMGKKLTYADFWLASFVQTWDDPWDPSAITPSMPWNLSVPTQDDLYVDLTKHFPALRAHKEAVTSIPEIKAWIEKRPKTIL